MTDRDALCNICSSGLLPPVLVEELASASACRRHSGPQPLGLEDMALTGPTRA